MYFSSVVCFSLQNYFVYVAWGHVTFFLFCPCLQKVPPYNGFGSPEDSLQNCLYLIPEPPKKNVVKMLENDHKVLRYSARLVSQRVWERVCSASLVVYSILSTPLLRRTVLVILHMIQGLTLDLEHGKGQCNPVNTLIDWADKIQSHQQQNR